MVENLLPIMRDRYPEFFQARHFAKSRVCRAG